MKLSSLDRRPGNLLRRDLLKASLLATATGLIASPGSAQESKPATLAQIEAQEHWAMKGAVKLYLYRKRRAGGNSNRPVLFFVHGSTFSGRGSYDLIVPGHAGYSAMDHFAGLGYDVWTMDHEGFGFSSRTAGNSGIQSGVEDLKAALPLIETVTGKASVMMFGASSGAIRAGAFAVVEPKRVDRLILHAFTYTGKNAPEIERRKKQAESYKANPRRPFGMAQVQSVFNRDVAGKGEPAVMKALADYELRFGDSVPSGTYLDMAVNMPMVDPTKLNCPVCLIRPEHDGNATEEELFEFFNKIASKEKSFVFVKGLTHGGGMISSQRQRLWHIVQTFLSAPPPPSA